MWKESNRPLIQACFWIVAIHSPWFYSTKTLAKESGSTNHHSQSPTAEIQVENTHLHNDISPKKPHNIALSYEDSFNHLAPISELSPLVWPRRQVQKFFLESSEDNEEVLSSLSQKRSKNESLNCLKTMTKFQVLFSHKRNPKSAQKTLVKRIKAKPYWSVEEI